MTRGVVAAGHRLTAEAAAKILAEGGNAFDAAIAALVTATIAEPALASLGGGGFLMAHRPNGETALYDFFVETPLQKRIGDEAALVSVHADFGTAVQEFHIGLGSTATPGVVPGLFAVHADLGSMDLAQLFAPAIAAARDGVPVTGFQAYVFRVIAPILMASQGAKALFAPDGGPLRQGDIFRNPDAAETLAELGKAGEALFVDGAVGEAILAQSAQFGGHLTKADLGRYRVVKRKPLRWRHGGSTLYLNPPPSAGGALIAFGLHHLEAEPGPSGALALYRALAATCAVRRKHDGDLNAILAAAGAPQRDAQGAGPPAYRGTTHVSVIDADGNAASASLSNGEGNGHMLDGFGIMLNNMLGETDLVPASGWAEGTRLSSMMAPTVIESADGSLIALGTGGSNRIRTAILQVARNLLDRGMDLEAAIQAPRMHVESCGTLSYEPGLQGIEDAAAEATSESAAVEAWPAQNLFFGGVHAAKRSGGGALAGKGDPRRDGVAILVD